MSARNSFFLLLADGRWVSRLPASRYGEVVGRVTSTSTSQWIHEAFARSKGGGLSDTLDAAQRETERRALGRKP